MSRRAPAARGLSTPPEAAEERTDAGWLLADDDLDALRFRLARAAQVGWAALSVHERARRLHRAFEALTGRLDELADLIEEENGKPRVEAIGHEVGASIDCLRFLTGEGPRILAQRRVGLGWMVHRRASVELVPHGVVLVISPWNIPFSIPFGQVVAALLAGNAVVLKPSEVTPRIGAFIARILAPCELPANLLSIVQGGGDVGARLIAARPDKVFFTGSVATGRKVMAAAAAHPIPVSLELGGVDAMIVLADADLDLASSAALWGATFNGGQVCASVERILVDESVREPFRAQLIAKLRELDPRRDLGRITLARQREVYERHLGDARARGLRIHLGEGGSAVDRFPTAVIDGDAIAQSQVFLEETFGPMVAIAGFRGERELLALHDACPFGLTASLFSRDVEHAQRLARRLRVGLVSINDVAATLHAFGALPWGGVGESGFGRSHGEAGLLECVSPRVIESNRRGVPDFKRPWWYPYDPDQLRMMRGFTRLTGARRVIDGIAAVGELGRGLLAMAKRSPRL